MPSKVLLRRGRRCVCVCVDRFLFLVELCTFLFSRKTDDVYDVNMIYTLRRDEKKESIRSENFARQHFSLSQYEKHVKETPKVTIHKIGAQNRSQRNVCNRFHNRSFRWTDLTKWTPHVFAHVHTFFLINIYIINCVLPSARAKLKKTN